MQQDLIISSNDNKILKNHVKWQQDFKNHVKWQQDFKNLVKWKINQNRQQCHLTLLIIFISSFPFSIVIKADGNNDGFVDKEEFLNLVHNKNRILTKRQQSVMRQYFQVSSFKNSF